MVFLSFSLVILEKSLRHLPVDVDAVDESNLFVSLILNNDDDLPGTQLLPVVPLLLLLLLLLPPPLPLPLLLFELFFDFHSFISNARFFFFVYTLWWISKYSSRHCDKCTSFARLFLTFDKDRAILFTDTRKSTKTTTVRRVSTWRRETEEKKNRRQDHFFQFVDCIYRQNGHTNERYEAIKKEFTDRIDENHENNIQMMDEIEENSKENPTNTQFVWCRTIWQTRFHLHLFGRSKFLTAIITS